MNIPTGMVTSHYLVACKLSHEKKNPHSKIPEGMWVVFYFPTNQFSCFSFTVYLAFP